MIKTKLFTIDGDDNGSEKINKFLGKDKELIDVKMTTTINERRFELVHSILLIYAEWK